jgi:SAM-dependent methyltransferase
MELPAEPVGTGDAYVSEFFRLQFDWAEHSAEAVIPVVMELVAPRSVIDVGCGTGTWLATFARHGVSDFFGIDAPWVPLDRLEIPRTSFRAHDLSQPLDLGRQFDVAMCLEVGEHLPDSAANGLVELLTSLAPVVVFSAAIPGQGGTAHINEQWPDYWVNRFIRKNYLLVDCLRWRFWNDARVESCYAQNIRLLVRSDVLAGNERLEREQRLGQTFPLAAVHPGVYDQARSEAVPLRRLVRQLPGAIRRAGRRRLRVLTRHSLEVASG